MLTYVGVYTVLSAIFCWPLFAQPFANGIGDWDLHLFYYASVLRSAAGGELPFWNPWYCGGNVLWQNPQVPLVSPVYPLALVMPLALAMKFNILGHYIVGCLGMHLLIRRIVGVRSRVVVIFLVSLFVFSGAVAMHLAAGHSNFLWVLWLPALVYCLFRAADGQTRSLLLGAGILGVAILNGAPHVVPLAAVLLGSIGLAGMVAGRTLRPMILAVVMVVAGCAYAAPKLVPAMVLTRSADFQDRRGVKRPDFMSVEMFRRALWDEFQRPTLRVGSAAQAYGWHEYGNYMGWFGASLAVVCGCWLIVFKRRHEDWRAMSAVIGLVAALLLTAGDFAKFAPASLLRDLPLFSGFRIPSRYTFLVPLAGAMCVAYAVRFLEDEAPWQSAMRRFIEILCIVGVCQLGWVNREHLRGIFILPPTSIEVRRLERTPPTVAEYEPPAAPFTGHAENSNLLQSMQAGVSPLNCYEPLRVKKIAVRGPVVIQGDGAVTFFEQAFSPNQVAARVLVGSEPVRVVLNQNFADGWSTNLGPAERDPAGGRPSAVLPAGYAGAITFTYVPPGLWMGTVLWVLAVGVSILVWRSAH
jgi:hypothetical protein